VDLAVEVDTCINIIWDRTSGVSPRIEEGFECGWKVGLMDVMC